MPFFYNPYYQFVVKSLLSGVIISFGCAVLTVCENKYIGSFLFALGLITIILKGYNLYTGKVSYWAPSTTAYLLTMFALNGIGCFLAGYLLTYTRMDFSAIDGIVAAKLNDTMLSSFILAIGCGAMMHIAIYTFQKGQNPLYVIMPIMFFIICGFEHCVANCGFFGIAHHVLSVEDWFRLFLMVIGNAVGSLMLSKLLPDPLCAFTAKGTPVKSKYDPSRQQEQK